MARHWHLDADSYLAMGGLVGVDVSPDMLAHAKRALPAATFLEARLEGALPPGPFDIVVSAFAVHHLPSPVKADLFRRGAAALRPGGRFVLCDVVVPTSPVRAPVPIEDGGRRSDLTGGVTLGGFTPEHHPYTIEGRLEM